MGKLKIDIISLRLKVKTNICRVIFLNNNCTDYGHPMRVFFSHIPNILADWADQLCTVKSRASNNAFRNQLFPRS